MSIYPEGRRTRTAARCLLPTPMLSENDPLNSDIARTNEVTWRIVLSYNLVQNHAFSAPRPYFRAEDNELLESA